MRVRARSCGGDDKKRMGRRVPLFTAVGSDCCSCIEPLSSARIFVSLCSTASVSQYPLSCCSSPFIYALRSRPLHLQFFLSLSPPGFPLLLHPCQFLLLSFPHPLPAVSQPPTFSSMLTCFVLAAHLVYTTSLLRCLPFRKIEGRTMEFTEF
ncbi:hypothetical protein C8R47DRAFT_1157288 [Mycena vitilis]|nr:hypothetical protein C8R47DRAFT_1157288 [Mycena vitilis]